MNVASGDTPCENIGEGICAANNPTCPPSTTVIYTVRKSAEYFASTNLSFSFGGSAVKISFKTNAATIRNSILILSGFILMMVSIKKALECWIEDNMMSFLINKPQTFSKGKGWGFQLSCRVVKLILQIQCINFFSFQSLQQREPGKPGTK